MVSTERNHRAREGNSRLPRPYCSKEVVLPRLGLAPCHMFSFPPCWLPEVNLLGKGNVGQLWGHGSLKHQPFMQRLHRHSSVSWESKTTNKPPLSQLLLNHSENSSAKTFQGLPRWGQPPHTVREEWPVTYQTSGLLNQVSWSKGRETFVGTQLDLKTFFVCLQSLMLGRTKWKGREACPFCCNHVATETNHSAKLEDRPSSKGAETKS